MLTAIRYHVPSEVRSHIDYITPGIKLLNVSRSGHKPAKKSRRGRRPPQQKRQFEYDIANVNYDVVDDLLTSIGSCSSDITPTCIRGKIVLIFLDRLLETYLETRPVPDTKWYQSESRE